MLMLPLSLNLGGRSKVPDGRHTLAKGILVYIKDGEKHRVNGPAEIHPDGTQIWFKNGLKHRVSGPAVVKPNGREEYWEEGKLIKTLKKER